MTWKDEIFGAELGIPFGSSANYLLDLGRPTVVPELPVMNSRVMLGKIKIAAYAMSGPQGVGMLERAAMVDPDVQSALEYQQMQAERDDMAQQLMASQQQTMMMLQQQQMLQQQLEQFAAQQQQLQQQMEQAEMARQEALAQSVQAQEASLSERVSSIEQREQLAQMATELKAQLEGVNEGLGQLRGQAATPAAAAAAPGQMAEEPMVDPTMPRKIQKEQEEAANAQRQAELQSAQAGEVMNLEGARAEMMQPSPEEMMAAQGGEVPPEMAAAQGGEVPPEMAAGMAPKQSFHRLVYQRALQMLAAGGYPLAEARAKLAAAGKMFPETLSQPPESVDLGYKFPEAGRLVPATEALAKRHEAWEEHLNQELLPTPAKIVAREAEKKKEAAAYGSWLAKAAEDELEEMSVEALTERLKELPEEQLQRIFQSLTDEPPKNFVIRRSRTLTVPSDGPAQGREEYSVEAPPSVLSTRLSALPGAAKMASVREELARILPGAIGGATTGALVGGATSAVREAKQEGLHEDEFIEDADKKWANVPRKALKGALYGALMGGATGAAAGRVGWSRGQKKHPDVFKITDAESPAEHLRIIDRYALKPGMAAGAVSGGAVGLIPSKKKEEVAPTVDKQAAAMRAALHRGLRRP